MDRHPPRTASVENPNLSSDNLVPVADSARPYALPTIRRIKHDRFKRIDATTLVRLIDGHYDDAVQSYTIVDCRYPYEYQGGHILSSVNLHTSNDVANYFIDQATTASGVGCKATASSSTSARSDSSKSGAKHHRRPHIDSRAPASKQHDTSPASVVACISTTTTNLASTNHNHNNNNNNNNNNNIINNNKPHAIIFHCEFSSERGPKLMKFLRERDRQVNEYPELMYPEIYLLDGGYKDFYLKYKHYCEPQSYKPMKCKDNRDELHRFKKQNRIRKRVRKENLMPEISFEGC